MRDIRFSNDPTPRNIDATARRILAPRLWIPGSDYPGYEEWADKALAQIASERKRSMVAFLGREGVGALLYQRCPEDPSVLEIRNLSVSPEVRRRHFADFLLKQVEAEASVEFPGVTQVVTDTKITNPPVISFFLSRGYSIASINALPSDFGHNGIEDVVLTKPLAA
jgi:ribosomal protein S18 acetylase RimI-like enzyme